MNPAPLHSWLVDPEAAIQIQERLRQRLVLAWEERRVETVAGVDIHPDGAQATAAIVALRFADQTPLAAARGVAPLTFPYIPGLLAFREGPAVLAAWQELALKPDLVIFDGQGIAHPRRFGIAAHLGLWLEVPTIGVAKSRLYGRHGEVGPAFGDWAALQDERDPTLVIGAALRSKPQTRPIYVSPGHRMDLAHALEFTLACCRGYRLPEPIRWAHRLSRGGRLP